MSSSGTKKAPLILSSLFHRLLASPVREKENIKTGLFSPFCEQGSFRQRIQIIWESKKLKSDSKLEREKLLLSSFLSCQKAV